MVSALSVIPGCPASVELANWRDLNSLRYIERVCFPKDVWPLWDLVGILTFPDVIRMKAVIDDQMVGFVGVDMKPSQQQAWIATLCVLPGYRRRGIGSALLRVCEDRIDLPAIKLSVRASNQAAIILYRNYGYQRVEIWPAYYQDGEDAVVMAKSA